MGLMGLKWRRGGAAKGIRAPPPPLVRIGFTSGFSQEHRYFTAGEQITVEQLTELSIVMRISRYDHVYRHHVRDK